MSRLDARLKRLEAQFGTAAVYAVLLTNSTQVEVLGTGERLPLDMFQDCYPRGIIVKWLTTALWEAL
jgi:hypothetical protein